MTVVTGIDPGGDRAWCATLTLVHVAELRPDALRFPSIVAQYPDQRSKLTLGIGMPRSMAVHLWTWALTDVSFAAPNWRQTPTGAAELREVVGPVDKVGCETQWLNMEETRKRHKASNGDAPQAWQGVYKLAQTLGVVIAARCETAQGKPEVDQVSPSTWRSIALKGLDWKTREQARGSEARVAGHLLNNAVLTHVGGLACGPTPGLYTGIRAGCGGLDCLTADPRADLAAALCIGLATAGIPWYAVTPVTDLAVQFAANVPLRARPGVFTQARG